MNTVVKQVSSKKDLETFIRFPEKLYKNEPNFIPCLRSDEREILNPKKNKAFEYCEAVYYLAYKDGKVAGRIAGIINHNANKDWNGNTVRFGWIDFIEDFEVCKALVEAVESWGREKGMTHCSGPLGFSDMDKEGMLVEGFENEGTFTTIYNYPYYPKFLEQLGYTKEADWVQEIIRMGDEVPSQFTQFVPLIEKRFNIHVVDAPSGRWLIKHYGKGVFECLNEAFKVLYEFSPMSDEQINTYLKEYAPFLNKDLACVVVDGDDKVIGFCITMPSMSEGYKAANGVLLRGAFKLLKCLRKINKVEMLLIGILPEYQAKGVSALIFNYLHSNYIRLGIKEAIANPKLETNTKVQRLFDYYEQEPYQRRRSYGKDLQ